MKWSEPHLTHIEDRMASQRVICVQTDLSAVCHSKGHIKSYRNEAGGRYVREGLPVGMSVPFPINRFTRTAFESVFKLLEENDGNKHTSKSLN